MKITITILLLCLACIKVSTVSSQELIETAVVDLNIPGNADVYDFSYDTLTGNFVYVKWDSQRSMCRLISRDGTSGEFNYIIQNNVKFFSDGSYVAFGDRYEDSLQKASTTLIVNGDSILSADFIESYSAFLKGKEEIEFVMKSGDKYYLGAYSRSRNEIRQSSAYDELRTAYKINPDRYGEGDEYYDENSYFLDSAGDRIYVGVRDGKAYFVSFNAEKFSGYTDIDNTSFSYAPDGDLCFIAKSNGGLYSSGRGFFVVKGDRKFKTYDYIYSPLYFDGSGSVYYMIADSTGEYEYDYFMCRNNDKLTLSGTRDNRSFDAGLQNIKISPDGKIRYIGARNVVPEKGESEIDYYNNSYSLIEDGKEYELGYNIRPIRHLQGGTLLYAAQTKYGDVPVDLFMFSNGVKKKLNTSNYKDIYDYGMMMNGKIYYTALIEDTTGGNYSSSVDLFIDGRKIGNFPFLVYQSAGDSAFPIVVSPSGNYAFVTEEKSDELTYFNVLYIDGVRQAPPMAVVEGSGKVSGIYDMFYSDNGKLFFTALTSAAEYYSDGVREVFVDNKSLGKMYNTIGRMKYDSVSNEVTFKATRGKTVYDVKVKL